MIEVVIIREVSNQKTIVRCNRCKGSGENNYERFCHVCNGKGTILIEHEMSLISCGRCKGSGENNYERFCSVCHGCGVLPVAGSFKHLL